MAHPNLKDARELADWRPALGVISVYLDFRAGDRGEAWRTELRNGTDRILDAAKDADHDRRVGLRTTVGTILERYEDGDKRPPPRAEVGFVEVGGKERREHWWSAGAAASGPAPVALGDEPVLAPFVDLAARGVPRAVAILSAEHVRLLLLAEGALSDLEDWELSVTSLDWRERKGQSGSNPAPGTGGSSGHDAYDERLENNRQRFLVECGSLAGHGLEERGIGEVIAFGSNPEIEKFESGLAKTPKVRMVRGGDTDLIATPTGQLVDTICTAAEEIDAQREATVVAATLEEVRGGGRGAGGRQDVAEALAEGRVERLVVSAEIGEVGEELVRGALRSSAEIAVVHGEELAAELAPAEGTAALLRY